MSEKKKDKKAVDGSLSEHAAALGRVGGKAGGPARNRALSHEEKVEIARKGGLAKSAKSKALKSKLKKRKKKDT